MKGTESDGEEGYMSICPIYTNMMLVFFGGLYVLVYKMNIGHEFITPTSAYEFRHLVF